MKHRRLIVGSLSLVVSAFSFVAYAASTSWGNVTEVRAGYSDGKVSVVGLNNAASCSSSTIDFLPSSSNPDAVQRLATAALLSGKELKCSVDGCTSAGGQNGKSCWLRD